MISIIVPAYNEEKRIEAMISVFSGYFLKKYQDTEFIIISDGHDSTGNIVKKLIKKCNNIYLFEYNKRLGKGGGIIEGFKKARGDIVAFVDADESVSPHELEKIINEVKFTDCAVGSRRVPGSHIVEKQPLQRRFMSRIFNLLINLVFNLNIRDTQCGAKAFRRDVITSVMPEIKSKGFEFDVELLWRIKSHGFSIKEVPIEWRHSEHSRFSLKNAPLMFMNLMKIRFEG